MSLWFRSTFSGLHSYAPGIPQFAIRNSQFANRNKHVFIHPIDIPLAPAPQLPSDAPSNDLRCRRRSPASLLPPYRTVSSQSHKMCYDLSGRIPPAIWPGLPV
jgi:hypothetical protein